MRGRMFAANRSGSVATAFAIGLPVVAMAGVGAIELGEVMSTRAKLQVTVDRAALIGASQLAIDSSAATIERTRLAADAASSEIGTRWTLETDVSLNANKTAVTVSQTALRSSFFGNLVPPGGFKVATAATAKLYAGTPLCVLALQGSGSAVMDLSGSSTLTASTCLVQSNRDIAAGGSARVVAGAVRAVGGVSGQVAPQPLTDAPSMSDPFAGLDIKVPNRCDDTIVALPVGTVTLNPGVHCGSISLLGSARIHLKPGEHYFTGSDLKIGGNVELTGSDVVLIFGGSSVPKIVGDAVLSIDGRTSGPYAGFAIIAHRGFTSDFAIESSRAKKIQGTIYLPNGSLTVAGSGNRIADQSPWTVVVAKRLQTKGSAELVINSSYASASVPLPTVLQNRARLTR